MVAQDPTSTAESFHSGGTGHDVALMSVLSFFNPHSGELSGNCLFLMHRLNRAQNLLGRSCRKMGGCPPRGRPSPAPVVWHWPRAGLGSALRHLIENLRYGCVHFQGLGRGKVVSSLPVVAPWHAGNMSSRLKLTGETVFMRLCIERMVGSDFSYREVR